MPSDDVGRVFIAGLFRLIGAELLERGVDKSRLENILGRRRDRQVAELHVELGGELLDRGIKPAIHAPQLLAVEVADHGLEKREVEIGSRSCRAAAASSGFSIT